MPRTETKMIKFTTNGQANGTEELVCNYFTHCSSSTVFHLTNFITLQNFNNEQNTWPKFYHEKFEIPGAPTWSVGHL
jgi:hypothetical protein